MMMELKDFGYTPEMEKWRTENAKDFEPGRIVAEHKERYTVQTTHGEIEAEITGNMRFAAQDRRDFPAVGDWVAITVFDTQWGIIHKIFPRSSVLMRAAVAHFADIQIIATNIDYAILVQATNRDFNINRLERYLTLCHSSGIEPLIVLSKADLVSVERLDEIKQQVLSRIQHTPVFAISNTSGQGIEELMMAIQSGKTYCLLGSSGVGKSSLSNVLSGRSIMKTDAISSSTNKGRHVTSHRELLVLPGGAIFIDNPGMREVGIADSGSGIQTTFEQISMLADECKFADCTHTSEVGCKVLYALEKGDIDAEAYENFLKLGREKARFDASVVERRQKEKQFGKIMKQYKKDMKNNEDF